MIPYLASFLREGKCHTLVSPFAGGASFELAMLEAGVVHKLKLNDLDYGVYATWWVILHMPDILIERIRTFKPSHKAFFDLQKIIKSDYKNSDLIEAAWATLLVNRLAFSGIAKANPLGGKSGSIEQLTSRWNPGALINRIKRIASLADAIEINCLDAITFIGNEYSSDSSTIFIDPPYVQMGESLYNKYYQKSDHMQLAMLLRSLYYGTPSADIIVTYDYNDMIKDIYYQTDETLVIGRNYSIA